MSSGRGTGALPGGTARSGSALTATRATAAPVPAGATPSAVRTAHGTASAARGTPAQPATAGAPAAALPRTGLDNHLPLAGAGGLLALGGGATIFGQLRRRRPA